MQGVIKAYLPNKNFGFIDGDDGRSYFFHKNSFKEKGNVAKICDQAVVKFEQHANPKGYEARQCKLVNPSSSFFYAVPDDFLISRKNSIYKWEIIERGEWVVRASSSSSPDQARKLAIKYAQSVGANGLVELEYSKSTDSDGNYQFSVHHYQGRIVTFAKRNSLGTFKISDLSGLNQDADSVMQRMIAATDRKNRNRMIIKTVIWLVAILLSITSYSNTDNSNAFSFSFISIISALVITFLIRKAHVGLWLDKVPN